MRNLGTVATVVKSGNQSTLLFLVLLTRRCTKLMATFVRRNFARLVCLWGAFQTGALPANAQAKRVVLTQVARFRVPTGPKSLRHSPNGKYVVVNCLYGHKVAIIDAHTYKTLRTVDLPDEPVECDFSHKGNVTWVSLYNQNRVAAIDLQQGKIVGFAETGKIPKVVAVSPNGDWVYVANWASESISVIDSHAIKHVKDVHVGHVPRGICFDGSLAYVAIMGGYQVTLVDSAQDHKVAGQLASGFNPRHVVLSPDAKTLYVSNNAPGTVTEIDLSKGKPVATMKVGKMPRTIAIAPQGDALFVCNYKSNNLGIIDLKRRKQVATQKTIIHPIGASISPTGATIWVSSYPTSVIQVFRIDRK